MKLVTYVDEKRGAESRRKFLERLHAKCEVSLSTLQQCLKGYLMDSYSKAKKISRATNGSVTVRELCER